MFDSREFAILVWTGLFILVILSIKSVRPALLDVLKAASNWKIVVPLLTYFVLVGLLIWWAHLLHLMTLKLMGSLLIWVAFTGAAILFKLPNVLRGEQVFGVGIRDAIGLGAILALFLNARTFALPWELLIVPVVTFFTVLGLVAERDKATKLLARLISFVSLLLAGWLLWASVADAINQGEQYDWYGLILSFAMPAVLAFVTLAYLFFLSIIAAYESLVKRVSLSAGASRVDSRAMIGAATVLKLWPALVSKMNGRSVFALNKATGFRAGAEAARSYRVEIRDKREKEERRLLDLERYAGVDGADSHGRRYDRREFRETKSALEWLSGCAMGWYRQRDGSYDPDLITRLERFFPDHGLPSDHGIQAFVSPDGQTWCGLRRTVTGWVFGIGARGGALEEYFYDGPEPPAHFPGQSSEWVEPRRLLPNWSAD